MMHQNWKYAPEWANWLAMDADGEWCWYEDKPTYNRGVWSSREGKIAVIREAQGNGTLQKRPEEEQS